MTSLTTLVGNDLGQKEYKWIDSVYCKANKHVYGIPENARRVLKFNPTDKSSALIGPDLEEQYDKYRGGTEDEKGCIYCTPVYWNKRGMLKIDTHTDTVTILDVQLPERGGDWIKGVLGLDGNIYFMPCNARRILKLNTDTDTFESVGDDLGNKYAKFQGAVRGIDGCIYGIPNNSKRIVKYDPVSGVTSFVGEEDDTEFNCNYNGALARDGFIYAATQKGEVLKINTNDDDDEDRWEWVGNGVDTNSDDDGWVGDDGWGDAIMGNDGCIYWPPFMCGRILKHNPHVEHTYLVENNMCTYGWWGGALASDGVIYCMPYSASRILAIDPFREFDETLKAGMEQYPRELGRLFQISDEEDITNYDSAILKFGQRGFQAIVDHLPRPNDNEFSTSYVYPFVVAASLPNVALSVIYHLLRHVPDVVPIPISVAYAVGGSAPLSKKQKTPKTE